MLELLAAAGVAAPEGDGRAALLALSRELPLGDFRQTIEKLGLYLLDERRPPTAEDLAAVAPTSGAADVDALLSVVAEGRREQIADLMHRLAAQGVGPVAVCIAALRHFRQLHAAASDPGGTVARGGAAAAPRPSVRGATG